MQKFLPATKVILTPDCVDELFEVAVRVSGRNKIVVDQVMQQASFRELNLENFTETDFHYWDIGKAVSEDHDFALPMVGVYPDQESGPNVIVPFADMYNAQISTFITGTIAQGNWTYKDKPLTITDGVSCALVKRSFPSVEEHIRTLSQVRRAKKHAAELTFKYLTVQEAYQECDMRRLITEFYAYAEDMPIETFDGIDLSLSLMDVFGTPSLNPNTFVILVMHGNETLAACFLHNYYHPVRHSWQTYWTNTFGLYKDPRIRDLSIGNNVLLEALAYSYAAGTDGLNLSLAIDTPDWQVYDYKFTSWKGEEYWVDGFDQGVLA